MQTEATAATLPNVDAASDSNLRYFANDGFVDYGDSPVAVYVGGNLIGTFSDEQVVERDVLIVAVCRERRVRMNRVAEAFDVSTETVRRIRRKFERGGIQAIAKSHRPGRPRQRTPQLEAELFALFDAGASINKAHKQIGKRVSRSLVVNVRKKWRQERERERSQSMSEPSVQETLPSVADAEVVEEQTTNHRNTRTTSGPTNHSCCRTSLSSRR